MLIALVGSDGAGKSTQAARLRASLEAAGRSVGFLDMWSIANVEHHPECRFIVGGRELLRPCIAEMEGPGRALFLFWMTALAVTRMARSDIVIADGYWLKHAAAELAYGCPASLIEGVANAFAPADLVLYLDVEPEVALERKRRYGLTAYECARDAALPPGKFLAHQTKVRSFLEEWAARYGWLRIDANRAPDEVGEDVERAVFAALEGR